jgi:hypothetical protein
VSCEVGGIDLMIANLSSNEADTLVIIKYTKNSNFDSQLDQSTFIYNSDEDTAFIDFGQSKYPNPGYLSPLFDYKVITRNHLYEIDSILDQAKEQNCCDFNFVCRSCFTNVVQLRLNGNQLSTTNQEFLLLEF